MADDDPGGGNRLRTLKKAADMLGVSQASIYRLGKTGELELVKVGLRGTRVTQESIDRYIKNLKRMIPNRK